MTPAIDREVRQDVAEVLVRDATAIDRRDWTLFRTGFYDDELVSTDDGWKIASRRFTMVMLQMCPEGTSFEL